MYVPVVATSLADYYFLWWAAQLLALAIIIWRLLRWRPGFLGGKTVAEQFNTVLDARAVQIETQLQAAEESRKQAEKIRQEAAQDIERAKSEAEQIVTRAQGTANAIQRELEERAHEEYNRVVGQAREEIDFERRQAEAALQRRAADIVVDAAGQIVKTYMEPAADRRLIDQSLSDLRELR